MKSLKFRRSSTLAVATALLAGCTAVGPNFQEPQPQAPKVWEQIHGGAIELAGGVGASTPSDWTSVKDPVLQDLFKLADEANPDIRIAAIRFAQARIQKDVSASQKAPQIGARASATKQRQSAYGAGTRILDALGGPNQESLRDFLASPFASYDAGLDFSWELDLWGRVARSIEASAATAQQQQALRQQVRMTIRAEVARTYVELRSAQVQLHLAKETLEAAEASLKLVDAKSVSGLVPEIDVVQQRGIVAELRTRLPRFQQQESAAHNTLTLLCGTLPGTLNAKLAATSPALLDRAPPALDLGLPSEFAARRADVQAALAELHAATANIGVAIADLYPQIKLGASAGFQSLTAERFGEWSTRQWSVGPSLELPVFDGGRRRAVVKLRELAQQEAAVRFQRTVLTAWHEVDDAVSDYNAERLGHDEMVERVRSAKLSLSVAKQRYFKGLTSFVPVLDAQRTESDVKAAYAQHQARLWSSWLGVLKSIGAEVERF